MNLYPFIGIQDGKMYMFVSPFRLNKIGPMHSRSSPIPDECSGVIDPDKAESALIKMTKYYENETSGTKKK